MNVTVEGAPTYQGLRVDHPRLLEGCRGLIKQGYSNEHIIRIIGVPQEVVDRERAKMKKGER